MLHESKTVMGIDFDQKIASPFILRLDLANCMFGHTEPEPTDWWALLCLLDSLYNDPVPPSTNQFCWKKNQFRHTPHIVKYQMVSLYNSSFHNALLISTESFLFLRLIWWVTHSILGLLQLIFCVQVSNSLFGTGRRSNTKNLVFETLPLVFGLDLPSCSSPSLFITTPWHQLMFQKWRSSNHHHANYFL